MTSAASRQAPAASLRKMLIPLALAQFICSFAGSNMNVMINDIKDDLHTTVQGVQVCITLFLLVMAALMIPCGKLTDRWGRKRCFTLGLSIYGVGAVLSAVAPGLGILILGNSIFEGVGTAVAGTILVAGLADPKRSYGIAMVVVAFFGLIGLIATILLPGGEPSPGIGAASSAAEQPG